MTMYLVLLSNNGPFRGLVDGWMSLRVYVVVSLSTERLGEIGRSQATKILEETNWYQQSNRDLDPLAIAN